MRVRLALYWLLTLTTSASAQGAWVLWAMSQKSSAAVPLRAGTRKECAVWRDQLEAKQTQETTTETTPFYNCLPDTADPRGPKGK